MKELRELDAAVMRLGEAVSQAPIQNGLVKPYDDVRLLAQAVARICKEQSEQLAGFGAQIDRYRGDVATAKVVADRAVYVQEVLKLERKDLYDQLVAALGREAVLSTRITIIRLMLKETETLKIGVVDDEPVAAAVEQPTTQQVAWPPPTVPVSSGQIETTYKCDTCSREWTIVWKTSPKGCPCDTSQPPTCPGNGEKIGSKPLHYLG